MSYDTSQDVGQDMNQDITRSSANTEPQLLLESGPMMLRDWNPRGVLRFTSRKCMTCGGEIMDHWLRQDGDGQYFCTQDGQQVSEGMKE